jgi:hypothetical protein
MALGFVDSSLCGLMIQGSHARGFWERRHNCDIGDTVCSQGTEGPL